MVEVPAVVTIAVVGAGMMGSALCVPLADRAHDVRLIGSPLDDAIITTLRATGRHPKLGTDLPAGVRCYPADELELAIADADAIVLGVSSAGVGWAARALSASSGRRDRPTLMVSKGLTLGDAGLRVLTDVFVDESLAACQPVAVAGPCIAGELARRVPTLVVLTGRDLDLARRFAGWLETPYYHLRVTPDVIGVQVCAALKNAYAMGVGLGAGLHERSGGQSGSVAMHNYEAAVFAEAIAELHAWVVSLGGDGRSVVGLAGAGDLTVTCNGGRTGRFGALLGRGSSAREALESMQGATLECLEVLALFDRYLARQRPGGIQRRDVPLLSHLIDIALHEAPLAMPFAEFFRA